MSTPLYDELVVKYYLSKGVKPFSYPHEPVSANAASKAPAMIFEGEINMVRADLSKAKSRYFNLRG